MLEILQSWFYEFCELHSSCIDDTAVSEKLHKTNLLASKKLSQLVLVSFTGKCFQSRGSSAACSDQLIIFCHTKCFLALVDGYFSLTPLNIKKVLSHSHQRNQQYDNETDLPPTTADKNNFTQVIPSQVLEHLD